MTRKEGRGLKKTNEDAIVTKTDAVNDVETKKMIDERLVKLFEEARGVLGDFRSAAVNLRLASDGTCPIFYRDCVIHAALPWVDVDLFQRRLLTKRTVADEVLLLQLTDLLESLAGRSLVDVGSFTGSTAFVLRAFLKPDVTHLFEPQMVMQDALAAAVLRNQAIGGPITLHQVVLDEDGQEMEIGENIPTRMSQTAYLRRDGGNIRARSVDSMDLGKVGLIHIDFNNDKLPLLRGAVGTIERDKPVIVIDLTARDLEEVRELTKSHGYQELRIGRHSMAFMPK